jgi:hypothetical protein
MQWKKKDEQTPTSVLADYVTKKDKKVTTQGSQFKNVATKTKFAGNFCSNWVLHLTIPCDVHKFNMDYNVVDLNNNGWNVKACKIYSFSCNALILFHCFNRYE